MQVYVRLRSGLVVAHACICGTLAFLGNQVIILK